MKNSHGYSTGRNDRPVCKPQPGYEWRQMNGGPRDGQWFQAKKEQRNG